MRIRRLHLVTAVLAVLSSAVVVGCAADRSADAARIRAELGTMPGVSVVDVGYVNDFENGPNINISLEMPEATEVDIGAAAHRIGELTGSFDDHRRRTEITVAPMTVLKYSADIGEEVAYTDVATEARVLRAIRPRLSASWVRWEHYDGRSRVELWSAATPDQDLRAALDTSLAGATEVYVRSAVPAERGSWEVELPLTDAELSGLLQQLSPVAPINAP
ncbi:hypothetical protein [Mycolicibacterium sp. F2034L]|uniref:hypothetical protein n=1 Tax=Mycolicibacterium sp. F2034L TaxID=2926422 RepID=UPI001FF0FC95|nr:hypothetical protein [Mycolicibacterium sp. F2034L]MCK0174324.1 hypothetical protein [Mycolicibacterium sp. F2034L]